MKIDSGSSFFAQNQLQRTMSAIARSLQRLSTGLRVNSPQDDVAAFSESVTLDSQIRGLNQATRNTNDALSMLMTTQSAVSTQLEIVQKMREIAVQASNGTLTANDRAGLNTELQQLYQEFNRITSQTSFNGLNILDGSFGTQNLQAGASSQNNYGFNVANDQPIAVFTQTVPSGTYSSRVTMAVGGTPEDTQVADLNGDGIPDLITANNSTGNVTIRLGVGKGVFNSPTTLSPGGHAHKVRMADLNGDGKLDMVVLDDSTSPSTVSIYLGNGDGTFKARTTLSAGSFSEVVEIGDLNGDGKLDLVVLDGWSDYTISTFIGNGDGTFQARVTRADQFGTDQFSAALGDENGDGKLDLVTANIGSNINFFYAYGGNGNGTFATPPGFPIITNDTHFGVQLADLRRIGKLDAVLTDYSSGLVSVVLGNGDGTWKAEATYSVGANPTGVKVADVNGDGIPDIVTADYTDGTVSVLLGKGDGTFAARKSFKVGGQPYDVKVADINGDGVPDLISTDSQDGTISILYGQTMSASGLSSMSVSTQSQAQTLIGIMDNALTYLNGQSASLGAEQSRMQVTISGNTLLSQNLADAKSNLLDVDIAAQTSELIRLQILQEAQVAAISQANISNQLVLKLLAP